MRIKNRLKPTPRVIGGGIVRTESQMQNILDAAIDDLGGWRAFCLMGSKVRENAIMAAGFSALFLVDSDTVAEKMANGKDYVNDFWRDCFLLTEAVEVHLG